MINPENTVNEIDKNVERGIELLTLCQRLQSEKDGIARPNSFEIDKTKTLDQFAQDVNHAITNMNALRHLLPMAIKLADLGRKLEASGQISVDYGDDYGQKALEFFTTEVNGN
jgi:hypothetical protein